MILSENDIESELSYAYLHAVASRAGFACEVAGRHSDGAGIDARVIAKERFGPDSIFTEFAVEIQLKATSQEPTLRAECYSYALRLDHYDKLRIVETPTVRLLVVLFLPPDITQWLSHSEDGLLAKRCAYWVCLQGARASTNASKQTVYLPKANYFSHETFRTLMARVSRREPLPYVVP